jgi:hypothetical protein
VGCERLHELALEVEERAQSYALGEGAFGAQVVVLQVDRLQPRVAAAEVVALLKAVHDALLGHPVDSVGDRCWVVAHAVEHLAPLGEDLGDLVGRGHAAAPSRST